MSENTDGKTSFDSFCKSIMSNDYWEEKFVRGKSEMEKTPTFETYQKVKDDMAGLRNRKFYEKEIESLKKNSSDIDDILKKIRDAQNIAEVKEIYGNKDSEGSLVYTINKILGEPSSFPWAECNRMLVALKPDMFCAIPYEANVDKLIKLLEKQRYWQKNDGLDSWIDKANAVKDFFHTSGFDRYTFPWQVLVALGGLTSSYVDLLKNNRNLILTGAPGTGKTFLAKKIAKEITGKDDFVGFVQFHPSYDYTDFVEGLRPNDTADKFERRDGIFKEFCAKAACDLDNEYVFIIDEINRGEISKIFGELFFSIDPGYRGKEGLVKTQYQNLIKKENGNNYPFIDGFYVPENVYIIGTMNDIDRSVESMDFAFRRRFAFYEVTAEDSKQMLWNTDSWIDLKEDIPIDELKKKMVALNKEIPIEKLEKKMTALNKEILEPKYGLSSAYQIGASYFLKYKYYKGEKNSLDSLWTYHLEGLLFEYLRGKPNASELLKGLKDAYDKAK